MEINEKDGVFSVTQKVIYEIVKKEDEAIIEALKDYAKANSAELKILDEQKVKEIIKIGIMAYHAEELKNYSHSYIKKSKIEDIIIALNDGRNISKLVDYMKRNDLVMPEVIQKILQQLLEEN